MDYKAIGKRLRNRRKELALTQEKVAENIDLSVSFYSHIESGSRKASLITFVKIVEFMDVSLDYVILGIDKLKETSNSCDAQLSHRLKSLSDREKIFLLGNIKLLENLR